jgi:cystathionine gamma-synthase
VNDSDQAPGAGGLRPETLAAQGGRGHDYPSGGIGPAIQPATTYARRAQDYALVGTAGYTRDHNPTSEPVEALMAELDGGAAALAFASGLGAAAAVVQALAPGDHIVAPKVMYWGLRDWLEGFCAKWGLALDLVDFDDLAVVERTIRPGETKLVWLETPSNPLWQVADIEAVGRLAKAAGARLAVDNTVPTPVLTRPIALGADIVMYSATKYLNGHSDVLAGVLVTREANDFWDRVLYNRSKVGAVLGPFEAWLLQRGLRTLYLRVERASVSALTLARHLEGHSGVDQVLYPGLASHPGHEIAGRQMQGGFGGMMSVRVKGGGEAALAVVRRLRVFVRATSLGGVESLVEHRATIEGPDSPVPADLLRLSIGIEAVEDLIADFDRALTASA